VLPSQTQRTLSFCALALRVAFEIWLAFASPRY
jgi:hypothetical protein